MLDALINIFLVLLVFLIFLILFSFINYHIYTNEMLPQDAKFLKRKVKSGPIDVHPTDKALVLNYELEYQILGDKGYEVFKERKNLEKIISLPTLNSKTDCSALGKAIIEKCELIHPSKLAEIEHLLYYIKNRKHINRTDSNISRTGSAASVRSGTIENKPDASIINVDEYIELLYEDIAEKIKGSALILHLARENDNLEALAKNEAVLSALSRVLREDWKKSIVLSTNLIYTFFCFSTYIDFHPTILQYKIGSLCMDIIDFELTRYDEWRADLLETEMQNNKTPRKVCPNSASMSEIPRSKIPEPVRPRSGNWTELLNNKSLMNGSTYDDLSNSTDNFEERKQLPDAEKAKRYRTLIKKQEQLLRVAFYLLLNISEDENVEEKMAKKNIVGMLIKTLERENEDLLILVVTFLKKLSVFEVNKEMMTDLDVVEKLPKLLQLDNPDLVHITLKLMFNLSFDSTLRDQMIKRGFLPKFVSLLSDDRHQLIIIKLLYHLSKDDKVKIMFSYTDCVTLITDMILLCKDDCCDQEMIALGINLAINQKNAQQMVESNRLQNLMTRAFKYQNCLLMKMIRNIAEHKSIQPQFLEFVGDLARVITESKQEDFVQECVGVLGNIWLPDLDYSEIFVHFKLIPWLRNILKPKAIEEDFMLDVVIFLGTAAADKECAKLLCESNMVQQLVELLKIHQEDDEIVYQIIFVFLQILNHDQTRNHVILESDVPGYLIDLCQDTNKSVVQLCMTCLDIITGHNPDWCRRIQIERFRYHNAQWLQMVESHAVDDLAYEDEIDELPPYMNAEFLATHSVPIITDVVQDVKNLDPDSPDILDEYTMNRLGEEMGLDL